MKRIKVFSKRALILFLALAVIGFVAFVLIKNSRVLDTTNSSSKVIDNMRHQAYVGPGPYVESGLLAPTNKWFSSLVFKQESDPIYATPLALKTTKNGYQLSFPVVDSGKQLVTAEFQPQIHVEVDEVLNHSVSEYDDLSVEFVQKSGPDEVIRSRMTRGSPYVFSTLAEGKTVTITTPSSLEKLSDNEFLATNFGVYVDDAAVTHSGNELRIEARNSNSSISIYALPDSADSSRYFEYADNSIRGTEVSYQESGEDLETKIGIETKDGSTTIFGLLPHMRPADDNAKAVGSIETIEGKQTFYEIESDTSFVEELYRPQQNLDLSKLSESETKELKQLVADDIKALSFTKTDSYFAAKELYRASQLLRLADQLEMPTEAETAFKKLE